MASSIPIQLKTGPVALSRDEAESFDYRASVTSFASSTSGTTLKPPPLPRKGLEGRPFECPICNCFMILETDLAWYSHVYRDLQPYVSSLGVLHPMYVGRLNANRFVRLDTAVHLIERSIPGVRGSITSWKSIGNDGSVWRDVSSCSIHETLFSHMFETLTVNPMPAKACRLL